LNLARNLLCFLPGVLKQERRCPVARKSLVLELQEMATERRHDVSDLLRKALVVASKLKLEDFRQWVNWELHGYDETCREVPEYRRLRATMNVWNPFHGLQPFFMPPELEDALCDIHFRAPISNAVSTLERQRSGGKTAPLFPLTSEQKDFLMQNMRVPLQPVRLVSESQLDTLIDAVRSTVLEWSLKLEDEGIVGEGMTFSPEERERAAASTQIHIGNFQGVLGDVSHSQITQDLDMSVSAHDFGTVRNCLASKGVEEDDIAELEAAIQADPQPKRTGNFGPKVSGWMGKMISKAASGAWNIGTGAAGNLLTTVLASYYGLV
jgi:hypothetical protein